MKDISNALFKALIDHYWRARDSRTPGTIDRFPKGYAISYKDLCDSARVPIDPRNAGGFLYEIACYCKQADLPPMHSLVVNKELGMPGAGFYSAPGSEHEPFDFQAWEADVLLCISAPDLPRIAPHVS